MPTQQPLSTQPAVSVAIGVDLGRHQSFCSLADGHEARLVPVGAHAETGLWLRWSGSGRSERITDRIQRLAGEHQDAAVDTVTAVAQALFPEVATGDLLASAPRVVIPAGFGPQCRSAMLDGFRAAGIPIASNHLIERPLASLLHWLGPLEDPKEGVVCVVDNDHGQLSVCIAHLDARRLLVSLPLSTDGDDDPSVVRARLDGVLRQAQRLLSEPVSDDPRVDGFGGQGRPRSVDHVALSGTSLDHPQLRALMASVFPDHVPEVIGDETAPVLGCLRSSAFENWTASWPTIELTLNDQNLCIDQTEIRSGPMGHGADVVLTLPSGSRLGLRRDGLDLAMMVGTVRSRSLCLPGDLGTHPRLRIFDDGRVLVLGEPGARPLSLRVSWPAPTSAAVDVQIQAVGRRPLVLERPQDPEIRMPGTPVAPGEVELRSTGDRSHRATAWS